MKVERSTRTRILDAAEDLLQRRGFGGFSYQHIALRLGVRNAAIHYHFPAKSDLGVALIARYRESFAWWIRQMECQRLDPAARLTAFLGLEERYRSGEKVCPLGVICVEYEGVSDDMRREAAALAADLEDWLTSVLEEGDRQGVLNTGGNARRRALGLLALLQGGLQLSRLRGPQAFSAVLEDVRDTMGLKSPGNLAVAG